VFDKKANNNTGDFGKPPMKIVPDIQLGPYGVVQMQS
jgi:hypothetical protein